MMIGNQILSTSQTYVIVFLFGALIGSAITWFVMRKTNLGGERLTVLQVLNFGVILVYMFGTLMSGQEPRDTVLIAMLGFLFGEPIGRVIAGGRDGKKD